MGAYGKFGLYSRGEFFGEFSDLDELVRGNISKHLPGFAGRPPDLKFLDHRLRAQSDVLFQWTRSKGAAASHCAINRPDPAPLVLHRDLNSGAVGIAIGF